MAQDAEDGVDGHLPDTEESQDMVDTEGVEILRHPLQSLMPPSYELRVPIVGGEAPVLTIWRERIGRSTRLSVEVEKRRMGLGLHAVEIDADGDIAFSDDAI